MKNSVKFLFFIILFSGCSLYQITSDETTFDSYPPKQSTSDVAYDEQVVEPYRLIGYVTVNVEKRQKKTEILEKLKHEAAQMGGDAITNIATVNQKNGVKCKLFRLFENAGIRETYTADVIVFEQKK